ncbi:hypothetical protein AVANS_1083 [Campylobacter sp. RM5004]|uniref:glycosyltransferase n=1 Tax=Campylobacter sp. RM5004 TaxID=1660078 RepID=UPI001EFBE387|nr:glycosyltransferase [Campylobacter sp. RM5004]ULO01704.1 hypothetical protein AVANS_1083 [Campylobacter sp. RM5004]
MQISIISTVCYKNKNHFIYKRALELIEYFKNTNYEFIISDASKDKILTSNYPNIKIIQSKYQNPFSPAQARNEAIMYSSKKYILFYDIDLSNDNNFFIKLSNKIQQELETSIKKFILIPFVYLSQTGTKEFETNKNLQILKNSYLDGSRKFVENIGLNGVVMIINKEYLKNIGLFNINFQGHGGEDLELVHRLIANNPHSKKPDDYYINETSNVVANLKGFRKYMAYYTLPLFFEDLFLVHRWHDRPLFDNFYFKKSNNQDLLVSKMKEYDSKNKNIWKAEKEFDFDSYLKNLCKKYNIQNSIGLYSYDKNNKKSNFKSKLRKLITRPKEFFKDIKIRKYK